MADSAFIRPEPADIAGTAFEPVTRQGQMQNWNRMNAADDAWRTAEGSPWRQSEPGPVGAFIGKVLGSEPAQSALNMANFIGPGPRPIMRLKTIEQVGPVTRARIEPVAADVPTTRFTIEDGVPQWQVPRQEFERGWGGWFNPGPRLFRYMDEYLSPLGDGVFWRGSPNKNDMELLRAGQHRGSKNHATGEWEDGLSVARTPEAFGYPYYYRVKGKQIGHGSDSEPLLDMASVKPVGRVMSTQAANKMDKELTARRLLELGIHPDDWRVLRYSGFLNRGY